VSWLRKYINYKQECPICKSALPINLSGSKNRPAIIYDNKIDIKFELNTFARGSYANKQFVIIHIYLDTLEFDADFYYADDSPMKSVPLKFISSIKNLMRDSSFFTRECPCEKYRYMSSCIIFNWSLGKINMHQEIVGHERLSVQRASGNKLLFFEIVNDLNDGDCSVFYGSMNHNADASIFKHRLMALDPTILPGDLKIPQFNIEELDKTLDKIETYIIFS